MTKKLQECPFQIGQEVIYKPSNKGWYSDVMSDESSRLIPGNVYKVSKIHRGLYVTVEGYAHPGGGIYWTEFTSAED